MHARGTERSGRYLLSQANIVPSLTSPLREPPAWWPGPPKGSGDVLSIIPGVLQINLDTQRRMSPSTDG